MQYDIVSIVASTRGIAALGNLLAELPSTFHSPVVCLVEATERLRDELQSRTRLKVRWAESGAALQAGCVYLSRPGTSLVCRAGENLAIAPFGAESSALNPVDQFLTSVGSCYGKRGLALVLSGFDVDGVRGAEAMRKTGGTLLVLDRATAAYWGMAEPVIRAGHYDRVLTIHEVAEALRACFTSQDLLRCAEIQIELRALLDTALMVSGTRMGHIQRLDSDTLRLRIIVQRGFGVDFFERYDGLDADSPSAAARAVRGRRRVVVEDVMRDPDYEPMREMAMASGFRAVHATPLIAPEERVVGLVATLFSQPHVVTTHEARNLDDIAREAAQVVARFP